MNVLEEVEGKVIIWANYQRDMSEIKKSIIKEYGEGFRGRLLWIDCTRR